MSTLYGREGGGGYDSCTAKSPCATARAPATRGALIRLARRRVRASGTAGVGETGSGPVQGFRYKVDTSRPSPRTNWTGSGPVQGSCAPLPASHDSASQKSSRRDTHAIHAPAAGAAASSQAAPRAARLAGAAGSRAEGEGAGLRRVRRARGCPTQPRPCHRWERLRRATATRTAAR